MEEAKSLVNRFVSAIIENNPEYEELDRIYLCNRVYGLVGDEGFPETEQGSLLDMVDALLKVGIENQKIEDLTPAKDILIDQLMDLYTPTPAIVNRVFWNKYRQSPVKATNYFFELSKANDYIKTRSIAKNIKFPVATEFGNLEITINLSKPEKDPKAIAAAKNMPASSYPKCQLCMENEGYLGRMNYPARSNHRIIRLELANKEWGFQYSPYAYFNEHSIFLDSIHEPMAITDQTFKNLLMLVEKFPHYTVGSNADLPIVGGSMLTHDHYQGGRHTFPMAKAPIESTFELKSFRHVTAGIVHWPMACLRLASESRAELAAATNLVAESWKVYSDEALDIRAFAPDGTRHHTVTPIARINEAGLYEMDIVLRDNQTSKQYPDGIFHPHQDVQHIKQENIGLIEVMGLAVLPARLKTELAEVEKYILGEANQMVDMHKVWADQLTRKHTFTSANIHAIMQHEVGLVFLRVLEDAGVYKQDDTGKAGFKRFINQL